MGEQHYYKLTDALKKLGKVRSSVFATKCINLKKVLVNGVVETNHSKIVHILKDKIEIILHLHHPEEKSKYTPND